MTKVVINNCFGGFSLSKKAVARMAELQGRPCYFFTSTLGKDDRYAPTTLDAKDFMWTAFDIPNPNEALAADKPWHEMTMDEKMAHNAKYTSHIINEREGDRTDPILIRVVEELGEEADGMCARLKIVEIPDGVEWVIDEYDGNETIDEKHRSWS